MALDPQVQALLDQMAALEGPELWEQTPAEARQMFEAGSVMLGGTGAQDVTVEDRTIPGPEAPLRIRIYTPAAGSSPRPVVVFYHGGGFVIGNIATHDATCRDLASQSGAIVVSVDYRLAPEHPFPAAVDDAYGALEWVAFNAGSFGGDPARMAVAGDSAGGNLSAVVAQLAHSRQGPPLRFQLLVYPGTDLTMSFPSIEENAEGYFLTRKAIEWFVDSYLAGADPRDPMASPLFTPDLSGLPPAHVVTAGYDPLRDEGEAYADRLREFGVSVTSRRYDELVHGCFTMQGMIDAAKQLITDCADALRTALR